MLVTNMAETVTIIFKLSPRHNISNIRHQYQSGTLNVKMVTFGQSQTAKDRETRSNLEKNQA